MNDDQESTSSRKKKKSNAEYRFTALNVAWDDLVLIQKVTANKLCDDVERFKAIDLLRRITEAVEQGKTLMLHWN